MRAVYEDCMNDTCVILAYGQGAADVYGMPGVTYTPGADQACGFKPTRTVEVMGETETPIIDAELRLPISLASTISNLDRIRLTHRQGAALSTPVVYEIIGLPLVGIAGMILKLSRLTDGSST
jgi:hypothetical protein